jgi:hypothetical protein
MRTDFISRLALLLVAGFLVIVSLVWAPRTIEWLFIVGGAVMIVLAAVDWPQLTPLNGIVGLIGVWSIVQAVVFTGNTLEWVSFVTALAAVAAAVVGLAAHEVIAERLVRDRRFTRAASA